MVLVALSFIPAGQSNLVFVLAALAGVGISAAHAIPLAILPDVIDWDELRRAQRQEAAYYSVITLIQKLVGALTIALTGLILSATGYMANASLVGAAQPASALTAIRILAGPLPAIFFIAGIVLVSFYPISRARHARILNLLEKRRRQRAAHLKQV